MSSSVSAFVADSGIAMAKAVAHALQCRWVTRSHYPKARKSAVTVEMMIANVTPILFQLSPSTTPSNRIRLDGALILPHCGKPAPVISRMSSTTTTATASTAAWYAKYRQASSLTCYLMSSVSKRIVAVPITATPSPAAFRRGLLS